MTIVGGGVTILGVNVESGMTAPFSVLVWVTFAPNFVGDNPAVELSLETDENQLVQLPGFLDSAGQPQYLRVATSDTLLPTVMPGAVIPDGVVRPKAQMLMQFQNGLPLTPGHMYRWRVKVDGDTHNDWTETMFIPTAAAGPVVG